MHFDLTTLKLFISVADTLSLTKAAEHEHLVLAAVSRRVKELESALGVQLLYRHARGVTLTPAGHSLMHYARQVMHTLDRLRGEIGEYAIGLTGHVRIHANTAVVTQHLPEELAVFLAEHPQIRIELQEMSSLAIVRSLRSGAADLGIVESTTPRQDLQSLPYRSDRLVVVVPSKHALARRRRVRFTEIADYDLVTTRTGSSLSALLTREAMVAGLTLKVRVQLRGFDCICRMIQAGVGIGVLPDKSIAPHLRSMHLTALKLDESWTTRHHLICFRDLASLPEAAERLVRRLSSAGKGDPL